MRDCFNLDINLKDEAEFWISNIHKPVEKSSFANSYSECNLHKNEKSKIDFSLPENVSRKIINICNRSELGVFIFLLSGVNYVLARHTGNKNIIVAIPKFKLQNTTNRLLLLNTEIVEEYTFRQFLLQIKNMVNNVKKIGKLSIEEIQQVIGVEDFEEYTKLFDSIVLLKNIHNRENIEDVNVSTIFNFAIKDDNIMCTLEYNSYGLNLKKVYDIKLQLMRFFEQVINNPNIILSEIEILSEEEKGEILFDCIGKIIPYENNETLHTLFERQVKKTPDRIAVKFDDNELSYSQLNNKANKLAKELRGRGINQQSVVGLLTERSVEMIIGILGILKAGGAYLPIDSKNPSKRIEYLLKDSKAKILITHIDLNFNINFKGQIINFECTEGEESQTNLVNVNKSDDLSYIIYTSGTTGNPKGVMIRHRNVINLIAGLSENIYRLHGEHLNVACVAPYYFDASVQQIFASLLLGHKLILIPEDVRKSGDKLLKFYFENSIHISDGTPAHINMLANALVNNISKINVQHFIIGGEQLQYNLVRDFLKRLHNKDIYITNVYGPTECCVDCTSFLISKYNIDKLSNIYIGKAMPNQVIYILDKKLRMLPKEVLGEIYVSGEGVGLGYLNNEKLNSRKFIKDPFNPNLLMYKTGDIGRLNNDGYIECVGRMDCQVKIRGYRVELGEVENVLLTYSKNNRQENTCKKIRTCSKCLMNSSYPNINFNDEEVCNFCESYDNYKEKVTEYFKDIDHFKDIMRLVRAKNTSEYDCMLLYSGGKDSSYVLYQLVEMGYKVLAFTFDNGYISQRAFDNIRKITQSLNVDSVICSADKMKDIFAESLRNDSTVCSGCFKALTTISTKIAFDKEINVIVTGLSRGQIMDTKLQGFYQEGIFNIEEIEQKLLSFRKFYHSIDDKTQKLLNVNFNNKESFDSTYFIDFFRYSSSSADEVLNYLKSRDEHWNIPEDTGFCSTNCLINDVGIYVHLRNKGFHNYMIPLSWSCRLGQSSKISASKELETTFDIDKIKKILHEIGYIEEIKDSRLIKEVAVVDNTDKFENKYLSAYFVSNEKIISSNLRNHLARILPEYEIPSYFIQVDSIPKNSNGKVDKKGLIDLKCEIAVETKYEPPKNQIEKSLTQIWADVFKLNSIGIKDNFFELGGHSLIAMLLVSKIQQECNVSLSLSNILNLLTIEKIAEFINAEKINNSIISKVTEREYYPVSSNQKMMFILNTLVTNSIRYNVPTVQLIKGNLDIRKLETVFQKLIDRHEAFRTSFKLISEEVVQVIHSNIDFEIDYIEKNTKDINNLIDEFIRPFDLMKAPLIRVGLAKLSQDKYLFIFDIHHIISDAITLNIITNEISKLYNGYELPEFRLQYKDYSVWQRSLLESSELKKQEEYWCNNFINYDFSSYLPVDFPNNSLKECSRNIINFNLGEKLTAQLEKLALETNTTLFMVLLTAYNILLNRYTDKEDIVIGTSIAGRHYLGLEKIVGVFINTLAIRNYPNKKKKIRELLNEVKENVLKAFKNQDYPFDELVGKLDIKREITKNPIFDTMFILQGVDYKTIEFDNIECIPYEYNNGTSIMDLILEGEKHDSDLKMHFEYNGNLFRKETIQSLVYDYIKILRTIINEDCFISEIQLRKI